MALTGGLLYTLLVYVWPGWLVSERKHPANVIALLTLILYCVERCLLGLLTRSREEEKSPVPVFYNNSAPPAAVKAI